MRHEYMMFVVADPDAAAEAEPSAGDLTIEQWLADVDGRGKRITGDAQRRDHGQGQPRAGARHRRALHRVQCCHPVLALDGQVALTLKTVAGLPTAEIARAFLVSEPTMSQRLLRTRRKITNAGIPYRVPPAELLAERTSGVLAVLYLIFNAGHGQHEDYLAAEALRLARLLVELMPGEDEARGLLALIAFQTSRRSTRFDARGDLVPIEDQDRGRWDAALIEEGRWQLRRAAS